MIGEAVEFIRKELHRQLDVTDEEVILNSARKLIETDNAPGAYISLVNVEEEAALHNLPQATLNADAVSNQEPPVNLNIYLLFAFDFQTYASSLHHLERTIEFFHTKRWFGAQTQSDSDAFAFPAGLDKLVFEMVNLNFEDLSNLWGALGGFYCPSVVYKVRLVGIQRPFAESAPGIATT